jgi:hypothetical protein
LPAVPIRAVNRKRISRCGYVKGVRHNRVGAIVGYNVGYKTAKMKKANPKIGLSH